MGVRDPETGKDRKGERERDTGTERRGDRELRRRKQGGQEPWAKKQVQKGVLQRKRR